MRDNRLYYLKLDIIRIIACLLVVLYHLHIVTGGFLIVCTFFTLSSYLEAISTFRNDSFSIKEYYKKRFIRLYLPLLVVISITLIVTVLTNNIWINFRQDTLSSVFGYNNFWQLQAKNNYFTKSIHSPFTHLWYISILIQYDLIFPVVIKVLKTIEKNIHKNISFYFFSVFGFITTILFYFVGKNKDIMTIYYNSFLRSFSFVLGILLASNQCKSKYRLSNFFLRFVDEMFLIYLTIIVSICIFILKDPNYYVANMVIITLFSCRLIEYATLKASKINMITTITSYLSNISYEVYLVHFPILFFIQKTKINIFPSTLLFFSLTIVISSFIHYLLTFIRNEFKINRLKKVFIFLIILIGGIILFVQNDSKKDLEVLEKSLMDKTKIMEKKNKEYIYNSLKEEEEWQKKLEDMDLEENEIVTQKLLEMPIVGVGDSVFLDAVDKLYQKFPNGYFDGKVSRSLIAGLDILIDLKDSNRLPNNIVLALSTNGDYSEKLNKKLMDIVENREVYWINSVGADDPKFNSRFEEFAKNYSNIHIVDWEGAASGHSEYFYADGIHPKGLGINVYVNTIYDTIYDNMMMQYEQKKNELLQSKEQEEKKKLIFYGNDVLVHSYELLNQKFENSLFVANTTNNKKNIFNDLKERVQNNTLEYRIVFLFDKEISISEDEYRKIIDLCRDYEIYICNFSSLKYSFHYDNVKVIDFYSEFKRHEDYYIHDKIHLSKKGNNILVNKLWLELNH